MKFGQIAVCDAKDAVLGHSVSLANQVLRKGLKLQESDVSVLLENSVEHVFAARLEEGDVGENEAATAIADVLAGECVRKEPAATGRVNLYACQDGLVNIDAVKIEHLNQLDESLTIACLAPFERVTKGQMVATIKIIPYAVPKNTLDVGTAIIAGEPPVKVCAFEEKRVGLIITKLPHSKSSLIEKTEKVMAERIVGMGSVLGRVSVVNHDANAISLALNTLVPHHAVSLVFGASAIVDRQDVVPVAVAQVGGTIEHLGMPVDPGNLLLLARIGDMPVIGVPTCARSMKRNGFDWVLERLLANIEVDGQMIQKMGVGGLLKEISSRPQPRDQSQGT